MTDPEQRAARYIAAERGAYEMEDVSPPFSPPDAGPATAPMFECAAVHDGQDAVTWLKYFRARFK